MHKPSRLVCNSGCGALVMPARRPQLKPNIRLQSSIRSNEQIMNKIKSRNMLLVILWSYGLYILMHMHQYIGTLIASWGSGQSFEAIISGEFESAQTDFIISLTALIVGVLVVFLITKFLWRRSADWMRLRFDLKMLIMGIVLGLVLPFVILGALSLFGMTEISWQPHDLQSKEAQLIIIGYACMAIFTGIAEEVAFRGMAVREIALRRGWLVAAIIGGLYFGAAHVLANLRNLTLVDAVWVLLAGTLVTFLFVAMYRRGRSLWLPIGFHMAWNFCLKGAMGITMSGNEAEIGLLNVELTGSPFLTGGNFGIEASIISLVVYIVVAVLFLRVPAGRHTELLSNH
jgi:membrane protease YdiL (CAAX protease family)